MLGQLMAKHNIEQITHSNLHRTVFFKDACSLGEFMQRGRKTVQELFVF